MTKVYNKICTLMLFSTVLECFRVPIVYVKVFNDAPMPRYLSSIQAKDATFFGLMKYGFFYTRLQKRFLYSVLNDLWDHMHPQKHIYINGLINCENFIKNVKVLHLNMTQNAF